MLLSQPRSIPHLWRSLTRRFCMQVSSATHRNSAVGKPKVIILTGPTAVGKTRVSLELAKHLGGEIISADSVQVYTGLDVGSDKIPVEQRQGIPHHLIDVFPPTAEYSAGAFYEHARKATDEILQRGNVPIVVGGTGLYLRWYALGRATTPASSPEAEKQALELINEAKARAQAAASTSGREATDEELWAAAVSCVSTLGDPETAARVLSERNNNYRLQRVLQVLLQNGGKPLAAHDIDTSQPLDYDFRCFFLHRPRMQLFDRILARVEEMVAGGLLQEAQGLLDAGLTPGSHVASRAIGYRQAMALLLEARGAGGASMRQVVQLVLDIAAMSRRLVKSQMTWFRDDDMYRWVDATAPEEAVIASILSEVAKPEHEGGCGDSGRLNKEEERLLRLYNPMAQIDSSSPALQRALEWVNATVAAGRDGAKQADVNSER